MTHESRSIEMTVDLGGNFTFEVLIELGDDLGRTDSVEKLISWFLKQEMPRSGARDSVPSLSAHFRSELAHQLRELFGTRPRMTASTLKLRRPNVALHTRGPL